MPPSPLRTLLIVVTIWCAGLGAAAQFAKISVIYGLLAAQYPGAGIGFMVSVVGLVGLLFGTTAGLLVQRAGYRRALVGATALGAVISGLQALMPGYGLMMLSRVVEGASHLAIVVAGPVLIAQVTPVRGQGLAMTLWSSFFGVSFALTGWVGLPLAESLGPWALFAAHGAVMAVIAALLLALLPPDAGPVSAPLTVRRVIAQHGAIYASPRIAAPALGFVFYTMIYVAILTLLPPMFSGAARGWVATGMPLMSIAVSLGLGVALLRWMPAWRLVQLGLALGLGFVVVLWAVWGGVFAVAAALGLASALGLVQGASFASIPQLNASPGARAMAAGAVAQLGNLGTTTGTPVLAWLIGALGIGGVLLFVAPLCVGGVVMHQWLAGRRRLVAE